MDHELTKLPYGMEDLEPHISAKTLEFHHGKHHQAYVNNLNTLKTGTPFENASLETIIKDAEGAIFNNAAQVWNHSFYFSGLCPGGRDMPDGRLSRNCSMSTRPRNDTDIAVPWKTPRTSLIPRQWRVQGCARITEEKESSMKKNISNISTISLKSLSSMSLFPKTSSLVWKGNFIFQFPHRLRSWSYCDDL